MVVRHQELPAEHQVPAGRQFLGPEMPWQQRGIRHDTRVSHVIEALALHDGGRRMSVVEQGGVRYEPFLAYQFLGVQAAVSTAAAHMSLSPNLPSNPVVRHIVSLDADPRDPVRARLAAALRAPGLTAGPPTAGK